MGRHSAPAEEDEDAAAAAALPAPVAAEATPAGRHASQDEPVAPVQVTSTGPVPAAAEPAGQGKGKTRAGSAADLALLRANPTLLARCLAAALVPFLLYVIVLLVIGAPGRDWLIWIWIPAVTAGVVAGAFLDRAHTTRLRATGPDVPADGSGSES